MVADITRRASDPQLLEYRFRNGGGLVVDAAAFTPVGAHTANASLASAVTLTAPGGADRLLLQALDQHVRYTLDGTTPTATTGFRLAAGGDPLLITLGSGSIKVIQETSGASIQFQWGT